jgi:hypothetical protein
MFRFKLFTALCLLCAGGMDAQAPLGIFEGQADVGKVLHPGSASYDAGSQTYTVSGSGDNMWFGKDEFYFVWKKISADELTFTANIAVLPPAAAKEGNAHRKGVLMIRQSLDPESAYVDVARHAEGLTSLQYREKKGASTHEIESSLSGPATLRIEKRGDRFYMWVAPHADEEPQFAGGSAWVEIRSPFYIGIGVCSHDKDVVERFAFSNLELDLKPKHPKKGSYSTIETVLLSGDARTALVSHKHLTAPGWTSAGNSITFVDYTTSLETPFAPLRTAAPVGPAVPVVVSDFSYFSSRSGETVQVWRKSADGSQSSQFTPDDFNNTSPHVSPDGQYLLFISYSREYNKLTDGIPLDLRLMTFKDNTIKTLVSFVGGPESLGPQPFSPDGKRIVFISYQSMASITIKF